MFEDYAMKIVEVTMGHSSQIYAKSEGFLTFDLILLILPDGQVSESVISFNEPNEYWKPGALDYEPLYIIVYRFLFTFFKVI